MSSFPHILWSSGAKYISKLELRGVTFFWMMSLRLYVLLTMLGFLKPYDNYPSSFIYDKLAFPFEPKAMSMTYFPLQDIALL